MPGLQHILANLKQTKSHIPRNQALLDLADYNPASVDEAIGVLQAVTTAVWTTHQAFPPERLHYDIFDIGESFTHILQRHPAWNNHKQFFDVVAALAQEQKYGSGRAGFILLLRYGGKEYAATIIPLLTEETLAQVAMMVLRAWGDASAADAIRPYLNHPKTFLRNEAKKYFKKIKVAPQLELDLP